MQEKVYITKEGLEKLKLERKELMEVRIPLVAKRILDARNDGDISENAEYEQAKQEQSRIEAKIAELEDIIKNAKISDGTKGSGITVGSKVKVHVEGEESEFHIVGALEADPGKNKISHESPIGAALLGKSVGDKIEIDAPIGKITYTILAVK